MDLFIRSGSKHYQLLSPTQAALGNGAPIEESTEARRLLAQASPASHRTWQSLWQSMSGQLGSSAHSSDESGIKESLVKLVTERRLRLLPVDAALVNDEAPSGNNGGASGGSGSSDMASEAPRAVDKAVAPPPAAVKQGDVASTQPSEKAEQPVEDTACEGDPVSMVSGEELLHFLDAKLPGPMPLDFKRTYRSGHRRDIGLGIAWSHTASEHLEVDKVSLIYVDQEGRRLPFAVPSIGQRSQYIPEGLVLERLSSTTFLLKKDGEYDRVFSQIGIGNKRFHLSEYRHTAYVPAEQGGGVNRSSKGFCITVHYNDQQKIARLQGNWGRSLRFERDGAGRLQRVRLRNDRLEQDKIVAEYDYDTEGNLAAQRNAKGVGERYRYHRHLIVQRTLATGFNFYFEWDGEGADARCVHNWGERGIYECYFDWDTKQKISKTTDSRGFQCQYRYNNYGQIEEYTDNEGGVHRNAYAHGRKVKGTDPQGHSTEYFYDDEGHPAGLRDALGHRITLDHFQGRPTTFVDKDKSTWRREYNRRGLLEKLIDPYQQATRYEYNDKGLLICVTDALQRKTRYRWSEQGDLMQMIDARGHTQKFEVDPWGQVVAREWIVNNAEGEEQSAGVTQFFYSPTGLIEKVALPNGDAHHYHYNIRDQLERYTDPQERKTEYVYDGLSQVVERIDAEGQRLQYEYDTERNLTALVNEKGERHEFVYDGCERLVKETGFDGRVQHYKYNAAGQLIKHLDAGQVVTEFERDALGQLLAKNASFMAKKSFEDRARFRYDAKGRVTEAYNAHHYLAFQYNRFGQVENEHHSEIDPADNCRIKSSFVDIRHEYQWPGFLHKIHLPDGQEIQYDYDRFGGWEQASINQNAIAQVKRDAMGRETERTQGALTTHSDYDPMGRLTAQTTLFNENRARGPIQREYGYDAFGNLSQLTDGDSTTRYTYDLIGRLDKVESAHPETFTFDPASNLIGVNGEEGKAEGNRLEFQGDRKFQYDARGNLILEARGKEGKLQTRYHYNASNQLIKVEKQGQSTHYAYDPLGRRVEKRDDFGKTQYLWVGDQLLQEKRKSHKKTYVYEPNTFRPLAMVQDDALYHYHLDHLGTPRELTDEKGEVVWHAEYRTYGSAAIKADEGVENNLRFQGQYFDDESGLHYNRHRYYNPNTGQFTTQDPIGLLGGINNYQYAPNPVGWIDPFGLTCKEEASTKTPSIPDPVKQRKAVAFEFYKSQGFAEEDIPSHLTGIDFNHPVEVVTIKAGQIFYQFQSPGAPQGNYYADDPNIKPTQLGISPMGTNRAKQRVEPKVKGIYIAQENTPALRSTAKAVDDFWSVKSESYPTEGGGTQYFTAEKSAFKKSDNT